MNMEGNWARQIGPNNKYQYNGKELNDDFGLNWNDYGARWYDSAIGRWNQVDPLTEKYYSLSPYNYVGNMPTKAIDPNGQHIVVPNESEAKTIVDDLNRAYVNQFGSDYSNAYSYRTKTISVTRPNENKSWYQVWKPSTVQVNEQHIVIENNENLDWKQDEYMSAMRDVIQSEAFVQLDIVSDQDEEVYLEIVGYGGPGAKNWSLYDGAGGGWTMSRTRIVLSNALRNVEGSDNGSSRGVWTYAAVAIHELTHHIHKRGWRDNWDVNRMRGIYKFRKGKVEHQPGSRQNSQVFPLVKPEYWQTHRE